MKWKTDPKYLRGLIRTLNYFVVVVNTGEEKLTEVLKEEGIPGEFNTEPYKVGMEAIIDYFGGLTVKATEDKELAERLIPIFKEAVKKKKSFFQMFMAYTQLLHIVHHQRIDEEGLEEWLKKIEELPSFKAFLEHPYDSEAQKRALDLMKRDFDNIMFA